MLDYIDVRLIADTAVTLGRVETMAAGPGPTAR